LNIKFVNLNTKFTNLLINNISIKLKRAGRNTNRERGGEGERNQESGEETKIERNVKMKREIEKMREIVREYMIIQFDSSYIKINKFDILFNYDNEVKN
jgi:hypothetical protein